MPAPGASDADDDELGPIDFLAIEFPGARIAARGFQQLLSLADQGVIGILAWSSSPNPERLTVTLCGFPGDA